MSRLAKSPDRIQARTRAMFAHVLSGWAMDLLELRRTGLIVPCARDGTPDPVMPFPRGSAPRPGADLRWAIHPAAAVARWRPERRAA
jgi:hypothetical protein